MSKTIISQVSLFIVLVVITIFSINSYFSIKHNENKELSNTPVVAGADDKMVKYVSGDSFSFVFSGGYPGEYILKSNTNEVLNFFEDKILKKSSFTAILNDGGESLETGIVIYTRESDGLDNEQFSKSIEKNLGSDYKITSTNIPTPGGFNLTKISTPDLQDEVYYTLVTSENYYLIKIINETIHDTKYQILTNFTDNLIEQLYLN